MSVLIKFNSRISTTKISRVFSTNANADLNIEIINAKLLEKTKFLQQKLNFEKEAAEYFMKICPNLIYVEDSLVQNNFNVYQKYGLNINFHRYPKLLSFFKPLSIENYIRILQESNFNKVNDENIYKCLDLLKQRVGDLKSRSLIPKDTTIIDDYINFLEIPKYNLSKIPNFRGISQDKETIKNLRKIVISLYLSLYFKVPYEDVMQKFFGQDVNKMFYKSLSFTKENLKILSEDFKFPLERIYNHSYLLFSHPDNLKDIKNEDWDFNMMDMVLRRPKILATQFSQLKKIEAVIEENGISKEALERTPAIFTISVDTIKERLKILEETPDLKSIKYHPRILHVIYYQNKVMSRIDQLKSLQLERASINILSTSLNKRFTNYINFGEFRSRNVDLLHYLSHYFEKSTEDIRILLKIHPQWLHIPFSQIQSTIKYLEEKFEKDIIYKTITIILYPKDKIEKEIENVITSGEAKKNDSYFLNMVLYFLEKGVHFSGNGVWEEKE